MREEPFDENEISLFERLKTMDAKKLAAKVPAWAKPCNPPQPFVFKLGAKPVFPAHVKPNTILAPSYSGHLCLDGPFEGAHLSLCDEFGRDLDTLTFTIRDFTGYYALAAPSKSKASLSLVWHPVLITGGLN